MLHTSFSSWCRGTRAMCVSLFLAGSWALADAPSPKAPIPDAVAISDAVRLVDEVRKDDIVGAKTPEQKAALSQSLMDAAKDEKDNAARFALLSRARDIAVAAGNYRTASAAVDEIDATFVVDALKIKTDAATATAKVVRTSGQKKQLVAGVSDLVDKAIVSDRYDIARKAADIEVASARSASDPDLAKAAAVHVQQVHDAEAAFTEARKAMAVLGEKPNDPAANSVVGRFKCFNRGDWKNGLPMLALGSDLTLQALAQRELADPGSADEQMRLADAWWDVSAKLTGVPLGNVQRHAATWYRMALPSLSGLVKAKVEKRLQLLPQTVAKKQDDSFRELLATMVGFTNRKEDDALVLKEAEWIRTPDNFKPPVTFRVTAQTNSTNIRIGYAADEIIFNWEVNPDELCVSGGPAHGRNRQGAGRVAVDTWLDIDLQVLPDSMVILVDGVERYRTQADFSRINRPLSIFQGAQSTIKVRSVKVHDPTQSKILTNPNRPARMRSTTSREQVLSALKGTWLISYSNGQSRTYTIKGDGSIYPKDEKRLGQVLLLGDDVLLDFDDGKLERVALSGGELKVEHFNPQQRYPNDGPSQTAVGRRQP